MSPGEKFGFFFLDAEKAFDRVNWQFMKWILKEINIGDRFQKAICNIYSDQTAALIVNRENTDKFKVQKGTRQGTPHFYLS